MAMERRINLVEREKVKNIIYPGITIFMLYMNRRKIMPILRSQFTQTKTRMVGLTLLIVKNFWT